MKSTLRFAWVSLVVIVALSWMLVYAFETAADRHAILVSAVIAWVVQLVSFTIARRWAESNMVAGWGLGMLIRFVVLAMYALVGVKVMGLDATSALVSLAAFFFVSTLAEPVLLKS